MVLQVPGRECMTEFVQEPIRAVLPVSAFVSVAGGASTAVKTGLMRNPLQLPFVLFVRPAFRSREDQVIRIVLLLALLVGRQLSHE